MDLDYYQAQCKATNVAPPEAVAALYYRTLGLTGEAGEVANKVKKIIRDWNGEAPPAITNDIVDELGDVLWYVAMLADTLGVNLHTVARRNLDKLASRYGVKR